MSFFAPTRQVSVRMTASARTLTSFALLSYQPLGTHPLSTCTRVLTATPLWSSRISAPAVATNVTWLHTRHYHSIKFSRQVEFCTSSPATLPKDTMTVASALGERERPLTLLFCWLMSKERHCRKYAKIYTDMGIDVLKIRISPFDLLRPTKGSHLAADQVLKFLHSNPSHSPVLVHGLSVGAYVFTECMEKVASNMEQHGHLLNRFVGQIWDSAVDIDGIPVGIPRAITNNTRIQKAMTKYLEWYMKVQYKTATIHYERASSRMHENFVGVPALFFFSNSDVVSTEEMNAVVFKKWERKGCPVYTKCWENSTHVSHFMKHPKEYEEEVVAFLEKVGMIEHIGLRASAV